MRVPGYWARREFTHTAADGDAFVRSALGWSYTDQADADRMAEARAERAARAAVRDGTTFRTPAEWEADPDRLHDAYYAGMPLHEPVLESVDVDGECVGLITRNRYGCRVLNADRVLFADVDLAPPWLRLPERGLLRRLIDAVWIRPAPPPPPSAGPGSRLEQRTLDRIAAWHTAAPGSALRVYRTFAGLRLVLVDRQYDPAEPATLDVLRALDSDPLYVQLTRRQECFRARLSPKPWRIGVRVPSHPSQIDHPDYPEKLAEWAGPYEAEAAGYATCRLVGVFGEPARDPVIERVVELHDRHTLSPGDKPLA
ncbi:MAG TPA: hypothetical protein VF624_19230 [Tepidisphaeraceae bacterium]|jgi:hypothetical protein